jgi:hypothetical protein
VPNIQRINKVEARRIIYEIKTCKKVNWYVFIEWSICDQLCKLQSLKMTLCAKLGHVINLAK